MKIKMIVFDMAGTTVADKNFVADAFQKAFKNQGMIVYPIEINPLMGYKKELAIQMLLEKHGVDFDRAMIDQIHNDFVDEMEGFYEISPEVQPAPGAEELFLELKERSIIVTLNTGFPRRIADVIINRFQWKNKGLVDDYLASDEVPAGRPAPFMIRQLMSRARIDDPRLVAKVGDTIVDVEEGKNAGCRYVIGILTGACTLDQLREHNPTHIINSLSEIHSLLTDEITI
jgi:phosphonatase-like hydrolase